jgi:protein SCO1/2
MKNAIVILLIIATVIGVTLGMVTLASKEEAKSNATAAVVSGEAASTGEATIGGPFTLTDHHGNSVTDADFRGKLLLVYFGFTSCPDVCPRDVLILSEALQALGKDADKVRALFISVDPERDTPEAMKSYLSSFHPNIIGLTGTPEQVKAAAKTYKVYYQKVETKGSAMDYVVDHSSYTYLQDGQNRYLTHFRHNTPVEEMVEGVKKYLDKAS